MKNYVWLICLLVVLFLLLILFIWYLFRYSNPYTLTNWMNRLIDQDRLEQNELDTKINLNIPSYCLASISHNQLARKLDADLVKQFDQIKSEILDLLPSYAGLPMVDLDPVQKQAFQGQADEWKVIWVRFLDRWGQKADQLPTLKKIVEQYPEIILLHVSVMAPGTILPEHEGISKSVIRYHLPIQIPEGDVYLRLNGHKIKWVERQGIVFDDCLPHSVTMKPNYDQYRILIFADLPRKFEGPSGWLKNGLSNMFHSMINQNEWLAQIKQKI